LPYARPTLQQLITQVQQDITSAQITSPTVGTVLQGLLNQAVLLDVANAEAGLTYSLYGYLDWISLQATPFTAQNEFLEAWAALKGVYRIDATFATGTFTVALGCTNGVTLPLGTPITSALSNSGYATTASETTSGGAVSAPIQATLAGSAGNQAEGIALTIATTITGIPFAGVASTPLTGGSDQETDAALRTRMLAVYASPPQGGDRQDYIEWASAVAGVTRSWVAPNLGGPGTVTVFTMFDIAEAAFGGFPQGSNGVSQYDVGPDGVTPRDTVATGDQLTVANAIVTVQPAAALVYSNAPINDPNAATITGLGTTNTAAVQAAIKAALTDMFLRLGNVGGTTNPVTGAAWTPIQPSDWYAAISSAPGVARFVLAAPTGPITPANGYLPTLGTITFET
jgi:uncharacterized phage protein gp47/JayE